MVAVLKISVGDDEVYEAVDANLAGGHFVIPSATVTESGLPGMKASTDAATNCLGVVINDCVTAANRDALVLAGGPAPMSVPGADFTIPDATSTVYSHAITTVEYTAVAVAFRAPLACAAAGKARAWVTGDGPAAIVGWCAEPGGVSSAGGFKKVRVNV